MKANKRSGVFETRPSQSLQEAFAFSSTPRTISALHGFELLQSNSSLCGHSFLSRYPKANESVSQSLRDPRLKESGGSADE